MRNIHYIRNSGSNLFNIKSYKTFDALFVLTDPNSKGLTIDTLKKHDAMQGIQSADDITDIEETSLDGGETFKTFGTFASDWSNCSNMSFNR